MGELGRPQARGDGMNPWWLGLPAAQVTLACGGHTHRLRWEDGQLSALDHDDAEAERTLAALGGQRCACVDALDAWSTHATDARVLVLASRGVTDPIFTQRRPRPGRPGAVQGIVGMRNAARAQLFLTPGPPGAATPANPSPDDQLLALIGLGGTLQDRLVATVAAHWSQRLGDEDDDAVEPTRPQLHAALYGRVTEALRTWLGQPDLDIDVQMVTESRTPSVHADDKGVHVELPFAWLTNVWARGFATSWGRFCLAAHTSDGKHWELSTVTPDLSARELIRVSFAAGA
jgi:hypothetical protein